MLCTGTAGQHKEDLWYAKLPCEEALTDRVEVAGVRGQPQRLEAEVLHELRRLVGQVRLVVVKAQIRLLAAVGVAQRLLEPRQELAEVEAVGGAVDVAEHVLLERGPDGPEDRGTVLQRGRVTVSQGSGPRALTCSLLRGTVMTWS